MRLHDPVVLPELESLECDLPQRSLLYRIPAMGRDAGQVEGLLSCLVRVAQAHSVNPRRLVRVVYASENPAFSKLSSAGFFIRHAGTVNGLGKYAELFLEETAKLTGMDFLRPMTLLPLQGLLPHNGAGLLSARPKWCPSCIAEMAASGDDIYRPLVWSFELYRVCFRHGVRMQDVCGHCGRAQPFIPRYPDLGRCDHCGGVLSIGEMHRSTAKLDLWVSTAITALVQDLPEIDGLATAERFVDFVKQAVDTFANGNRAKFCGQIGLPRWAVTGWQAVGEKPSLPQFLSICYGLNLMPGEILLETPEQVLSPMTRGMRPVPGKLFCREARPLLSITERKRLAADLAKIVNDDEDVRPLLSVAKSLGFTRSCLKYWFSGECEVILNKYNTFKKSQTTTRIQSQQKVVKAVVQAIRERGVYPSRRRVNVVLRSHKISLARQDLFKTYRQAKE